MKKVFLLLFVLGCASTAFGAERNIVPNGGFENSYFMQNLFDGVDAQGRVRVFTSDLNDVIYREGTTETRPLFACQPQFIDVNEDGLKDLVVASPSG